MEQKLIFTNLVGEAVDTLAAEIGASRAFVIVDSNTAQYVLPDLRGESKTIDTYVYNALMVNNNIALSSAASVLQSLCGVVCILLANWVVRKISEENAMF